MTTAIVTAHAAFVLMVSEAKTEVMRLQPTGGRKKVPFTVNAAGQVCSRDPLVVPACARHKKTHFCGYRHYSHL